MARSLKKGPFVAQSLMKRAMAAGKGGKVIKTWSRASTIVPGIYWFNFCRSQWEKICSRVCDGSDDWP